MKTAELIGPALDWAVAKCEDGTDFISDGITFGFKLNGQLKVLARGWAASMSYCPSTDWSQGGPIIERERILIQPEIGKEGCGNAWSAIAMLGFEQYGDTALIAAMRCFVASKLGDEVEIPEELTK